MQPRLRAVEGAVRGLGGQSHGTVEQVRHLRESAVGHLQQSHTFRGVDLGLRQSGLVRLESIDQREAGGIIGAGVDLEPEDNCCRVVERLLLVLFRLFAAYIAERLFKTPRDMGYSLWDALICVPFPCCAPIVFVALGCCSRE